MLKRFSTMFAICALRGLARARNLCDPTYKTLLPFVPAAGWPNGC